MSLGWLAWEVDLVLGRDSGSWVSLGNDEVGKVISKEVVVWKIVEVGLAIGIEESKGDLLVSGPEYAMGWRPWWAPVAKEEELRVGNNVMSGDKEVGESECLSQFWRVVWRKEDVEEVLEVLEKACSTNSTWWEK